MCQPFSETRISTQMVSNYWQDCIVFAITANRNLAWVTNVPASTSQSFWVSPKNLIQRKLFFFNEKNMLCLIFFRFRADNEREAMFDGLAILLPLAHERCSQLLPDESAPAVTLQKQILKIFHSLLQVYLILFLSCTRQWPDMLCWCVFCSIIYL